MHWNISNPIFRIDNTDNIFDVNVGNSPSEYDQVQIQYSYHSLLNFENFEIRFVQGRKR